MYIYQINWLYVLTAVCDEFDSLSLSGESVENSGGGEPISSDFRPICIISKFSFMSTSVEVSDIREGVLPISKLSYTVNIWSMLGLAELTKDMSVSGRVSSPYDFPS